jgi:hypothetical protein
MKRMLLMHLLIVVSYNLLSLYLLLFCLNGGTKRFCKKKTVVRIKADMMTSRCSQSENPALRTPIRLEFILSCPFIHNQQIIIAASAVTGHRSRCVYLSSSSCCCCTVMFANRNATTSCDGTITETLS